MSEKTPTKPRKTWKQLQIENAGGLLPAKELLKELGCSYKTATLFDLMRSFGYVADGTRKSSVSDELRKFSILTKTGEKYGENLQAFKANETEMFFYKENIPDLLHDLGEALIAQSIQLRIQS